MVGPDWGDDLNEKREEVSRLMKNATFDKKALKSEMKNLKRNTMDKLKRHTSS